MTPWDDGRVQNAGREQNAPTHDAPSVEPRSSWEHDMWRPPGNSTDTHP